jgi:hypothetical protein
MNMTINDKQSELVTTARTAGIWYLMMAISGILGFMIFHSQVFDSKEAQKTLTNQRLKSGIYKTKRTIKN